MKFISILQMAVSDLIMALPGIFIVRTNFYIMILDNKFIVFLIIAGILLLQVVLKAFDIDTDPDIKQSMIILFTLGVKEWIDGKLD